MAAYATRAQLIQIAIPAAALTGISTTDQDAALEAASRKADGYLRAAGYGVPILAWHADLTEAVCQIAALALMRGRGLQPEGSQDLKDASDEALDYLRDVAAKKVIPIDQTEDATPDVDEMAPLVSSDPLDDRGW